MKISIFSTKNYENTGKKWFHGGEEIRYFKSDLCGEADNFQINRDFYALSFNYKFEYDNDFVSFAYAEPYTYTDLQKDLDFWDCSQKKPKIMTREILCITLIGTKCEILTITNPNKNDAKKGIILTGRVHPGETVSSFVLKGIIEFLLSDDPEADILRENCIFKIIPMLNPDGVIQGNYRCSLSGNDLNRRYINPSKTLHPEIFYTKKMVRQFSKNTQIVFYCDLHGHSKKFIFRY